MKIKIKNTSSNPLPEYATAQAAGLDLRAALEQPLELGPLERAIVPTGLYIELPEGYEAQVRPRSGLAAKKGVTVLNAPGTIDADYRGEIGVILVNLSQENVRFEPGDRVAQLVIAPYTQARWEPVEALERSDRGSGGFGSTGKQ